MKNKILILGDILVLLIVTLIGFATHGETGLSFLPRVAAVFFPLIISWFAIAPWLGLFDSETTSNPRLLWRPAFALIFAGPLAVLIRGLILNEPILPIFAVVLSLTSALGIAIWRAVYWMLNRRTREEHKRN
jgi:hypothetical protein